MIKQKLLTPNEWSYPMKKLGKVKAIVLHWLADPKGTPTTVYNWFEQRKKGKNGYGSAHYCVGMDGEILQYIKDEHMAYHVGSKTYTPYGLSLSSYPNSCTIGIEMCHMNWEGEFSDETWEATKKLTAVLLKENKLMCDDITTHMEIVGWKDCPRWFKLFPLELVRFKKEVETLMNAGLKARVTAKALNVRDKPKGRKIATLRNGETVYVLGVSNGWYRILLRDEVGYASSTYLDII